MLAYELVCVVRPELQDTKIKEIDDKIKKCLDAYKVTEIKKNDWGLRRLAYPIQKLSTAHYFHYEFQAPGQAIAHLETNLGYEEGVLRFLTMKVEKDTVKNLQPQKLSQFGPEFVERSRDFRKPFKPRGDYKKRDDNK